jgi:NitT/TauT family transport system substrate-binding protein
VKTAIGRAILAALVLWAFVDDAGAASVERKPVRIEVPNTGNLQFFTLWVALGAGYFQQENLQPQIMPAAAPRDVGHKLLKGEADVALLPPPMFLGMMAENKPIVLFASLLANEPINLVARKVVAEARALSQRSSLQERLRAIAGLRVGLAPEVAPRLRALFASAGMDAERDMRFVVVPGADQVQAFVDGRVDVLFAHTPYLETTLVQHRGVLVAETSAGEVPELAGGQIHALATTREEAKKNPELIAAVTRAIYRAQRLIHSDRKATVDAVLASGMTGIDRARLEAIAAIYSSAVPQTPAIAVAGVERDASLYPAHPRAPDFSRVKASDYIAAQFAAEAVKPVR